MKKKLRKNALPSRKIAFPSVLKKAWLQVRANGLKSTSRETQDSVKLFEVEADTNIDRLSRCIRSNKFQFSPARAVLQKRKRPIVISDVESRIVQRAILDILQQNEHIQKYLSVPTSFGAIKSKGVPLAVSAARYAISDGASHYYKSDIKKFFTQIPREDVIQTIANHVEDAKFTNLIQNATNTEISNIATIPADKRHYFDFELVGTPQGCCLSPLLGNILLFEFDEYMNTGDITCLRYLDDFIIFAPSEKAVRAAYGRACKFLKRMGLDAYSAEKSPDKASVGRTTKQFDYLGVEFDGDFLRPASSSIEKLMSEVGTILRNSTSLGSKNPIDHPDEKRSLVGTFHHIHNKLKGWGNQYYFCNDVKLLRRLDRRVSKMLDQYRSNYMKRHRKLVLQQNTKVQQERRLLGVHLLEDSKRRQLPTYPVRD